MSSKDNYNIIVILSSFYDIFYTSWIYISANMNEMGLELFNLFDKR